MTAHPSSTSSKERTIPGEGAQDVQGRQAHLHLTHLKVTERARSKDETISGSAKKRRSKSIGRDLHPAQVLPKVPASTRIA